MPVTTINNPEYVVWPGTRQLLPYLEPGRHIKQIADYPERIWCQIEVVSGRERAMSEILQSSNIPSYYPQTRFFSKQQRQLGRAGKPIFPGHLFVAVKGQKERNWLSNHILVKKSYYLRGKRRERLLAELKFMVFIERINLHFQFQKATDYPVFNPAKSTKIVDCNGLSEILIIDNDSILNLYCNFQTVGQILTFSMSNNNFRALILSGVFKY